MSASGEPTLFDSGGLTLEGRLHLPDAPATAAVAVCHPHPLYGGDMNNNVVVALCRAIVAEGFAALRFNFRGAGGSEGSYSGGAGEQEDVGAALSTLESRGYRRLALAGYSFGAAVALAAAAGARVSAVAAVSPPVGLASPEALTGESPILLVTGARDDIAPVDAVRAFAFGQELGRRCRVEVVDGADHFWWSHEQPLVAVVVPFLRDSLAADTDLRAG